MTTPTITAESDSLSLTPRELFKLAMDAKEFSEIFAFVLRYTEENTPVTGFSMTTEAAKWAANLAEATSGTGSYTVTKLDADPAYSRFAWRSSGGADRFRQALADPTMDHAEFARVVWTYVDAGANDEAAKLLPSGSDARYGVPDATLQDSSAQTAEDPGGPRVEELTRFFDAAFTAAEKHEPDYDPDMDDEDDRPSEFLDDDEYNYYMELLREYSIEGGGFPNLGYIETALSLANCLPEDAPGFLVFEPANEFADGRYFANGERLVTDVPFVSESEPKDDSFSAVLNGYITTDAEELRRQYMSMDQPIGLYLAGSVAIRQTQDAVLFAANRGKLWTYVRGLIEGWLAFASAELGTPAPAKVAILPTSRVGVSNWHPWMPSAMSTQEDDVRSRSAELIGRDFASYHPGGGSMSSESRANAMSAVWSAVLTSSDFEFPNAGEFPPNNAFRDIELSYQDTTIQETDLTDAMVPKDLSREWYWIIHGLPENWTDLRNEASSPVEALRNLPPNGVGLRNEGPGNVFVSGTIACVKYALALVGRRQTPLIPNASHILEGVFTGVASDCNEADWSVPGFKTPFDPSSVVFEHHNIYGGDPFRLNPGGVTLADWLGHMKANNGQRMLELRSRQGNGERTAWVAIDTNIKYDDLWSAVQAVPANRISDQIANLFVATFTYGHMDPLAAIPAQRGGSVEQTVPRRDPGMLINEMACLMADIPRVDREAIVDAMRSLRTAVSIPLDSSFGHTKYAPVVQIAKRMDGGSIIFVGVPNGAVLSARLRFRHQYGIRAASAPMMKGRRPEPPESEDPYVCVLPTGTYGYDAVERIVKHLVKTWIKPSLDLGRKPTGGISPLVFGPTAEIHGRDKFSVMTLRPPAMVVVNDGKPKLVLP